jgi:hypothetical protein
MLELLLNPKLNKFLLSFLVPFFSLVAALDVGDDR